MKEKLVEFALVPNEDKMFKNDTPPLELYLTARNITYKPINIIITIESDETESQSSAIQNQDEWRKTCNWFDENGGGLKAEIYKEGFNDGYNSANNSLPKRNLK